MPLAMATGRCWKAILETIEAVIAKVKRYFKIQAATVASFDPTFDPNGKFLAAGIGCIRQIVSA
jgi:hypothetical protein